MDRVTIFRLLPVIYNGCLILTVAVAWRFGGRSERWGALILVLGTIATSIVQRFTPFDWRTHRGALIAVDVAVLAALLVLALRSRRFWPIWATAFHLIGLSSHGTSYVLPRGVMQAYVIFQGFWAYPIMVCIVVGALSHRPAARRRDPRPSSP